MNRPPGGPQSGPHDRADVLVKDFTSLQLKYMGSLTLDCMPNLKAQANNSAAAIDQLITNVGGAETLRDREIWQIIIGEEMHISSGAFYFSVYRTLAENTEFLCKRLGLSLPDSYEREPDKTQIIRAADARRLPHAAQPPEITEEDLFGTPPSSDEEMQVVIPKPPAPRKVQRWTRRALLGGAAFLTGFLGAHIVLRTYRTDPAKHTEDKMEEVLPPSPPSSTQIITDCRIRFIPEAGGYRGSCDLTKREGIKPTLQFRKRDPLSKTAGIHQADLLFSRGGKACRIGSPIDIIPGQTQEIQKAVFMCVAPPPK